VEKIDQEISNLTETTNYIIHGFWIFAHLKYGNTYQSVLLPTFILEFAEV